MSSSVKLRERAYTHIRQKLIEGEYESGSMLNVVALAKEIGVSRTPVAEALHRLELENVVEQIPRVGAVVREPSHNEICEMYDLRELMEGYAAARAAEQIDEASLLRLQQILDQTRNMCVVLSDNDRPKLTRFEVGRFDALDVAFHSAILQSAVTSPHVYKMIEDIWVYMLIFFMRRPDTYSLLTIADTYLWHSRIYQAICQRNADAARDVMSRHIRYGRYGVFKHKELLRQPNDIRPLNDADIAALLPKGWKYPEEEGCEMTTGR